MTLATRYSRRAFWLRQRIVARDANELFADMGLSPSLPVDCDRRDPLRRGEELRLKTDREATYRSVWAAVKQYLVWFRRHVWGLAAIYLVELFLSVIGLGLGVSAILGFMQKMWFAIGLIVAFIYRLLHHFWFSELIGAFYIKHRKAWLLTTVHDFFNSAIWTYSFLAITSIKLLGEASERDKTKYNSLKIGR
jgi:hypothetical protein